MGSEASNVAEHGWAAASPTVQVLISDLRTSFLAEDFQNVTKTLVEREESTKNKYISLKKKAETYKKEKGFLFSENQKLNEELKKKQKEIDALKKENSECRDQIAELKSEKSRVSKNPKLEDELKMKQSEIDEMRKTIAEFETKQTELTFYKKQSKDLHDRVSRLEKTAKNLTSGETSSFNLENKQQKNCAAENRETCEKGDNKKKTESKSQEVIEICDDEEEDDDQKCISTLKRKRCSDEIKKEYKSGGSVDKIKTGTQQKASNPHSTPRSDKPTQLEPRNLITSLNTCDPITDPNIKNVDEKYKSYFAKFKMSKKGNWGSKADMIEEFDKDHELCMNAICALYRQSRKALTLFDISRITELAKLLTDGDPQQKVTKVSELTRVDLDYCRRFAKSYSARLFNIYQNKTDSFFPPRNYNLN